MQVPTTGQRVELPDGMRTKLESYRRRVWMVKIGEGVLAGLFGLLLSYVFVFLLDRVWDTPSWLRGVLLAAGAAGLGIGFPLKCHRWVWRTRALEQVARLLRFRFPALGDQLLGIVELAHTEQEEGRVSHALLRAAVRQVDEEIGDRDFHDAVPHPQVRRWAWTAGVVAALVVAAFVLVPAAGSNALARWLMPWRDTPRYTFAQLDELPRELVVPYAEPFSLQATLSENTAWSPAEGLARFETQPPIEVQLAGRDYRFELPSQKDPGTLTVSVGDARKHIAVEPTRRPELTAVAARVALPEYLQYARPQMHDIRGGALSVVRGSRVVFEAAATRALSSVAMDGEAQRHRGTSFITAPALVEESTTHALTWKDELGLTSREPFMLSLHAVDDQAPTITCGDLPFDQVVLQGDVLSFDVTATDDYGVREIGIEWAGVEDTLRNPIPAQGEKLIALGEPEMRQTTVPAAFSPEREEIPPQSLRVRLFTVDYLPDRKRVYSPTYMMHVLTAEEHAIWLTQQLGKWFRQAQEVYEHEQMLHAKNVELRDLPVDELDRPENRRRVETQAAAEQANARRLTALTSSGEGLIAQAMRNDQFNVQTLEDWAEMLRSLNNIAANRMPSVADLLKQAASAPGKGQGSPSPPSQPQANSRPQVGTNRDSQPGNPGSTKPSDQPLPTVPQISDVESSFNESKPSENEQPPSNPSSGKFGLPTTDILGGGPPQEEKERPESPAQEQMAAAVKEQEELLAEFAKVADELQRILNNLEGSTFVKRFKAASRRQLEVAGDLNEGLTSTFGVEEPADADAAIERATAIAEREVAQSENLYVVQEDLEAYYNRVQDGKFKAVLDEMQTTGTVTAVREIADTVEKNYGGQSIAMAEFWADTLDRWAEQLVGPGCPDGGPCPGGSPDSLPPSIVLEVMRILEDEIDLREETRATEQARAALTAREYADQVDPLVETQAELTKRVAAVSQLIRDLPTAASFGRELALLARVEQVMSEATGLLARPDTGPEPIAAETEAIELLLQSRRIKPKGGGGGGSSPGGGGTGETDDSALALIGTGAERNAQAQVRHVGQATGVTGGEFPAEFRQGLDAFFSALEGTREVGTVREE
ncbi:MAG: hypothetical protein WDZ59_08735 [Pirellulales bacterium]